MNLKDSSGNSWNHSLLRLLLVALSLLVCLHARAQVEVPSGYQLAWSDDFEGTTLNTGLWTKANTNVPTNNSLQDYLPQQVSVANGKLIITSENIPSRGLPYRSGLVTSTAIQKYGRWEVRAKLPTTTGMWPAIWLLADALWPSQGEIDIMENRGDEPNKTSSAFHYGTNPPYQHSYQFSEHSRVHNSQLINFHNSFHDYAVEWDPNQLRFYVDDVHYWTLRDSSVGGFLSGPVGPMRLIINTAIGGDFLANPNASTVWPQRLEVEYVRAFHRLESGPTLIFENGDFESHGGSMAKWTTFGNSINNVNTSSSFVLTGNSSLKLYGQFNGQTNFSGVEQGISVEPGDEIVASANAWVPASDSIAGTGNRVELKIDYYRQRYGLFGSSDYLGSEITVLVDGSSQNNVWHTAQLVSTVPANAVEARLALVYRQQSGASGAVYVDGVEFSKSQIPASVTASYVYHGGWSGPGTPLWDALDQNKLLAKESSAPTSLGLSNLVNTVRGINGIVLEIENLPGPLSENDFAFQVSPQGPYDQNAQPPTSWQTAPAPVSVSTEVGTPSRVLIEWWDGAIIDRWLRITLLANSNTGLLVPEVYYIGHLRGETTGADGDTFTVSFSDVSLIRQSVGQNVDAGNEFDIDKNGLISFADILSMRSNVGSQLSRITIQSAD